MEQRKPRSSGFSSSTELSPREREIVLRVSEGLTTKEIAERLGISSWTVDSHIRRIFAKLHVTTRAAMVARELNARRSSPLDA
jgi:DNA-binding CsgD family transcriptional regulator